MKISETSGKVIECRVNHRTVRFLSLMQMTRYRTIILMASYETEQLEKMANFIDPRRCFWT